MKENSILSAIITLAVCGVLMFIRGPLSVMTWLIGYLAALAGCVVYDAVKAARRWVEGADTE